MARRYLLILILLTHICATLPAVAGTTETDLQTRQWQWSGVERIVVFADVHGAYKELVTLLQQAGVINQQLHWQGGKTHLVSLGDLLDRGTESRRVMDLIIRLQKEAATAGGKVHQLLGNHEIMNMIGDLRYVAPEEYAAFVDEESTSQRQAVRLRYQQYESIVWINYS